MKPELDVTELKGNVSLESYRDLVLIVNVFQILQLRRKHKDNYEKLLKERNLEIKLKKYPKKEG